jgi:hypothetical protein
MLVATSGRCNGPELGKTLKCTGNGTCDIGNGTDTDTGIAIWRGILFKTGVADGEKRTPWASKEGAGGKGGIDVDKFAFALALAFVRTDVCLRLWRRFLHWASQRHDAVMI